MLTSGKNLALISDAGTPGVSDPGSLLISTIREIEPTILIIPVPGATALGAIISVSGSTGNEFTFLGFIPHKKGRETFFKSLIEYTHPVVFYESCHRITKTLTSLYTYQDSHILLVGREMTKKFETYLYGDIQDIQSIITAKPTNQKGEFTLMLIPRKK